MGWACLPFTTLSVKKKSCQEIPEVPKFRTMKTCRSTLFIWFLTVFSLHAQVPETLRFSVENMDRKVLAGEDFYRFENRAWLAKTTIPEDQFTWSPTTALTERNIALFYDILKAAADDQPTRSEREKQVGDFFKAASEEAKI